MRVKYVRNFITPTTKPWLRKQTICAIRQSQHCLEPKEEKKNRQGIKRQEDCRKTESCEESHNLLKTYSSSLLVLEDYRAMSISQDKAAYKQYPSTLILLRQTETICKPITVLTTIKHRTHLIKPL